VKRLFPALLIASAVFTFCGPEVPGRELTFLSHTASVGKPTPFYTYRIVHSYPHDREAFTQGLVFEDGYLYEGTGIRGQSSLRKVDLETGDIMKLLRLPSHLFGEGITIVDDRIIQLTWKARVGFVYDKASFDFLKVFHYPTEGWGITYSKTHLIMSDGSSTLHFLDPHTFKKVGDIHVHDANGPVERLNELEYIEGEIYANVWKTDLIAKIIPQTGEVSAWIDLEGLLGAQDPVFPLDVLNGIAYDEREKRLFVTGKLWPRLFEIELISAPYKNATPHPHPRY
jgi:glutamine cyclotransferase